MWARCGWGIRLISLYIIGSRIRPCEMTAVLGVSVVTLERFATPIRDIRVMDVPVSLLGINVWHDAMAVISPCP